MRQLLSDSYGLVHPVTHPTFCLLKKGKLALSDGTKYRHRLKEYESQAIRPITRQIARIR